MDAFFKDKIKSYLKGQSTISKSELVECIVSDFSELKESTINVYLSRLKKEGVIKNPARGLYALKDKKKYNPVIDNRLKRLYNRVKKEYPFAEFCVWNTKWLNEFMRHQPFKFYTVMEFDKDFTESVFHTLKELGEQVFIEPDAEIFDLYISNSEDVIILKHLISESPLQEIDNICVPTFEKLMVDMTIDSKMYAAQQNEIESIYINVFDKFAVNKNKMNRYAYRRNRENQIADLINLTLAKIK